MAQATLERDTGNVDMAAPLAVISGDSHVGPLLEDMRQYCPEALLPEWDDITAQHRANTFYQEDMIPDDPDTLALKEQFKRNRRSAGHHDMAQRLKEMDVDGTVSEVIFHASQNAEPVPFVSPAGFTFEHASGDLDKTKAGIHIYNQWLADACATAPDRLLGSMLLPQWDIDASIEEMRWARNAGLRVMNFSAPRDGILGYDHPDWEPFWSACEDLGVVLATHAGAVNFMEIIGGTPGPHVVNMVEIEAGGWPARRAMHRMIFSGVFERHPKLVLMLTEQNGDWWAPTMREYDSSYVNHRPQLKALVPKLPSEYCRQNIFIGASFMSPFEAEMAVRDGYTENVIWGRDYPHVEGTWVNQDDRPDEPNMTRQSMRYCFSGIDPASTKRMVQDNGIRALGLDAATVVAIADQIAAPTLAELAEPIDAVPEPGHGGVMAFRTIGPWW